METNHAKTKRSNVETIHGPMQIRYSTICRYIMIGVLLRLVAFYYFHDYLEDNFAFVAPWNSFQRLRDGVALWRQHGLYAGGYHSTPWVASIFTPLINCRKTAIAVFTGFDMIAGCFIYMFTYEFLRNKDTHAREMAELASIAYVLNPLTVGICAVLSLSSLLNMILAAALYANYRRCDLTSTILISLASQLNIYYIVLLFAVSDGWSRAQATRQSKTAFSLVGRFATATLLYVANGALADIRQVFNGNIMFFLQVDDQTPNVGVFWYMFAQVFVHYRLFFLCVFQVVAFLYVWPLYRLMRNNPFALWLTYLQVISIVSSYATYAEFCIYVPLLFAFTMYHKYFSTTYLIVTALLVSIVTGVITLTQWLQTGSGNANFYFGACTTYMLALIGLVRETVNAHLCYEHAEWSGADNAAVSRYFVDVPAKRPKLA